MSKFFDSDIQIQMLVIVIKAVIMSAGWLNFKVLPTDEILGHQFDKRLESFAQCYLQSFCCGFLKKNNISTLVLEKQTKNIQNKKTRVYS